MKVMLKCLHLHSPYPLSFSNAPCSSIYDKKFFLSLLGRVVKVTKNGVYFIVIALLVAELFKILVYAN